MAPKMPTSPVSGTCKHALLHGRRDFADVIKYLEMESPGLFRWVYKVIRSVLIKKEAGRSKRKVHMMKETEVEVMQGHKSRMHTASRSWKRQGNGFSLRVSRRDAALSTP